MKAKQFWVILLVLFGCLGFPSQALAHALQTNYQLKINSLEIQSVFSSGETFKNAPVVIYPPEGSNRPPIQGVTNEDGTFVFEPDYSVTGEWTVEIGEDSHWDMLTIPVRNHRIELDAISQVHPQHPHSHDYLASQIIVAVIAICCGIGSQLFSHKFKL